MAVKFDPILNKLRESDEGTAANGLPTGGTTSQVLSKNSNTDYDASWSDSATSTSSLKGEVAHFIGKWAIGTTYAAGEAVCAWNTTNSVYQLYISKVDSNTGNDPFDDTTQVYWYDVVTQAQSVTVTGSIIPSVFINQNSITSYDLGSPTGGSFSINAGGWGIIPAQQRIDNVTSDASGGTFDLGTATGIAFDALQADIQSAIDASYGAGLYLVTGDAADFNITCTYGNAPLTLDVTNLTGYTYALSTVAQYEYGAYNATQTNIQEWLDPIMGSGTCTVTGDAPSFTIENTQNVLTLIDNLVAGTIVETEVQPLILGFSAASGTIFISTVAADFPVVYIFDTTLETPTWVSINNKTKRSWDFARYIGYYDPTVTYAYGDAVSFSFDSATTTPSIFISLHDNNLGQNIDNQLLWKLLQANDPPIIITGDNFNPNTYGQVKRITSYNLGNPTGGTFVLKDSLGNPTDPIAWDATESEIHAGLLTNSNFIPLVTGNAPEFTVSLGGIYGFNQPAATLDVTGLVDSVGSSTTETQALKQGGFKASPGSQYFQQASGGGENTVWEYSTSGVGQWDGNKTYTIVADDGVTGVAGVTMNMSGIGDGNVSLSNSGTKSGAGPGSTMSSLIATRSGAGNGSSSATLTAQKGGTGTGDATGGMEVTNIDSGTGNATAPIYIGNSSTGDGDATLPATITKVGTGTGNATTTISSIRDDNGDGGDGNATSILDAQILNTANGIASSKMSITHHTGGNMNLELKGDTSGVYLNLVGALPTTDPVVAGQVWEFSGDIAALTTYLAGGGKILVRSAG